MTDLALHPTVVALVRAICTTPEDDTPRLVYADWLEEHGEPERAEFIRTQVELARLVFDPSNWPPRRRERELLDAHWRQWAPDLGIGGREVCTNLTGDDRPGVTFRRGFVAAVTCTAEDWLRVTDDVFWHPDQTVECPKCGHNRFPGYHGNDSLADAFAIELEQRKCETCTTSGRVPRPFPTGAGRTAECTACVNGDSIVTYGAKCLKCSGTGRVPAPAALPHPVEEVWLTTWSWPVGVYVRDEAWGEWHYNRETNRGKSSKWPGITFHLPTPA